MRISAGFSLANIWRRLRDGWAPPLALLIAVSLVVSLAASPAEAKKRRHVRHAYAPPQAAMVLDAYTGKILYSANIDEPRYPASITKVMTLYLLFEKLKDGRIRLGTELKVSANAAAAQPSKLDLAEGSTITVQEAMYALVTKSANDVAVTVAENLGGSEAEFARLMTRKARALGMKNTTFRNASGLPDGEQVTTARDLIILAQRILADFPEHAGIFKTKVFAYGGEMHRNHNGLLFSYPGTEGLKTGFTHASGFNLLATVKRGDKHLLAVVLGGSSARDRNARMRTLLNAAWGKAATLASLKGKGKPIMAFALARPAAPAAKPMVIAKQEEPLEGDDGNGEDAPSAKAPAKGADAFAIAAEDMPERNPAFHPSVAERTLAVALNSASNAKSPAEKKAATAQATQIAAASAVSEPAPRTTGMNTTTEANTNESTASSPLPTNTDPPNALGPFHVQVGSYLSAEGAKGRLQAIHVKASDVVNGHGQLTVAGNVQGKAYFRARFGQFTETEAKSACAKLKRIEIECLVVRAE